MSAAVSNRPDGGFTHHLPRSFAHANSPSTLVPSHASASVSAIVVGGTTPTVGIGRPFSATSSRMAPTRFRIVSRVMRPGIQPSQYSAARRADAGVAPPYQNGIGPAGFG